MSKEALPSNVVAEVVDLASFRKKKHVQEDLSRGRTPLYMSHLEGKVSGSPHLNQNHKEDFSDRLSRIKASLERINSLMNELKKSARKE